MCHVTSFWYDRLKWAAVEISFSKFVITIEDWPATAVYGYEVVISSNSYLPTLPHHGEIWSLILYCPPDKATLSFQTTDEEIRLQFYATIISLIGFYTHFPVFLLLYSQLYQI